MFGFKDDVLSAMAEDINPPPPSGLSHTEIYDGGWRPKLNKGAQEKVYDTECAFTLAYGERGSGKTISALHKLVRHAYENNNALCLVIVGVKRMAEEGGSWHKLQMDILPEWQEGLGFDRDSNPFYTQPKTNTAKDVFIWIRNRFNGWSRVVLLSMPVGAFVSDRVKGMEPSFVMVDEAQTLETDTYFRHIVQQVGRRPGITTKQQVVYCANPAGPSHWLYHYFFERPIHDETGEWNPEFLTIHVPVQENLHNLAPNYWKNVLEAVRGDEIEEARMTRGEWIDRPEGAALFKEMFKDTLHVRGDFRRDKGIIPIKGHPVIIGYDPGAAHTSIHFLQYIATTDKLFWLVFDELNYVGKYMPYFRVVPELIGRMQYWEAVAGSQFKFEHISDESAFNQYRAKDGSYDAWDIEQLSKDHVEKGKLDQRFVIKMKACPKGPGSVEARVRALADLLSKNEIVVSATCPKTREMLMKLEEDKDAKFKPRRSPHLHPFDSLTYPIIYYCAGRGRHAVKAAEVIPAEAYVMGRR